jgi:hypothetical protein
MAGMIDGVSNAEEKQENECSPIVGTVRQNAGLDGLQEIMARLEEIEKKMKGPARQERRAVICWNCGQPAHLCRQSQSKRGDFRRPRLPKEDFYSGRTVNALRGLSTARYSLHCKINNLRVSLMIDTGAAVSLIDSEVWNKCASRPIRNLGTGEQIVGVDGSPLSVRGTTDVEMTLEDKNFYVQVLVVDSLTVDGILGIDFLRDYQCIINIPKSRLEFTRWKISIPLDDRDHPARPAVHLVSTLHMPPQSEMEILAEVKMTDATSATNETWLLESEVLKGNSAVIARAVVRPRQGQTLVRILNPSNDPITLFKGMKIGNLEKPDWVAVGSVAPKGDAKTTKHHTNQQLQQLEEMVEECSKELTVKEKDEFLKLLLTYSDVFTSPKGPLGRTGKLKHTIDTGNSRPIRQGPRRIPFSQRLEVRQLVDDMLAQDTIQPSTSPWASPIVLVKKKDGSTRFCIDYRKLNSVTHKDAFPLPRIDDTLDSLAGSQWFTTLYLASGYWQVKVAPEDRPKIAFCTNQRLFEFKVMPFGLCNAPATFQRLMNFVLGGLPLSSCWCS